MDEEIKILIVDDQPLIRRALARMLAMTPGLRVVAEAADGAEAVRHAQAWRVDVVLMDLQMPRLNGVQATRKILEELPQTHIVVLTTFDTEELVFDAISSGAQAYLLKDASEEEIVATIRGVVSGESRIAPQVARKLLERLRSTGVRKIQDEAPIDALSPQEERVLTLLTAGKSNSEIAEKVFLAEGTVKNYVSRLMEKFDARTRTELAVKALRRPSFVLRRSSDGA